MEYGTGIVGTTKKQVNLHKCSHCGRVVAIPDSDCAKLFGEEAK